MRLLGPLNYLFNCNLIANHLCVQAKGFVALLELPLAESSVPNFELDQTARLIMIAARAGTYDETL
jgi:hypothetical protein